MGAKKKKENNTKMQLNYAKWFDVQCMFQNFPSVAENINACSSFFLWVYFSYIKY